MIAAGGDARPRGGVVFAVATLALVGSACAGCSREPVASAPPLPVEPSAHPIPPPSTVFVDGAELSDAPIEIEPAFHRDDTVTRSEVRVRRIIYRFVPIVTYVLGPGREDFAPPTGELFIDIAGSRMRARFVGTGFPVDENSEVRMRADEHGTYIFDGRGGRPVGTGQLAAWFQSGPGASGVELKLRQGVPDDPHTIELVCRLFGEWAGASIAAVRRTCAASGLPTKFKFGPYSVQRTAESIVYLPESALRSDELEPPRHLRHAEEVQFFEARALAQLVPSEEDPPELRMAPNETRQHVDDGMLVENRTAARVLVTIDGIALGWLDPSRSMHVTGMPPGGYRVGAMLPLGGVASRTHAYLLPAHIVLGR